MGKGATWTPYFSCMPFLRTTRHQIDEKALTMGDYRFRGDHGEFAKRRAKNEESYATDSDGVYGKGGWRTHKWCGRGRGGSRQGGISDEL